MWLRVLAVAATLTGCGRIGYDAVADGGGGDGDGGDGGPCPGGYTPLDGSCYRFHAGGATWTAAEADCEADGAGSHLITLIDVAEHYALHGLAGDAAVADTWIGYSDRISEGMFRWVSAGGLDPSLDQCYFGAGGPANSPADNCVLQLATTQCGDWFVRPCTDLHPYVCEHDGYPADPGSF